jgi:hypothetical protein
MKNLLALALVWFVWTSAEGSLCYADALEKVPARYRAVAREFEPQPLADYARLTVVDRAPAR